MMVTWSGEIEKWEEFGDITYTVLHGPNKRANLGLDVDIYLINPEGLLWLFEEVGKLDWWWDILVVDESTKFANSTTKRYRLLKPSIPRFNRRWILTGTPSPNGLEGLFGQIYILDLGRALGRYITHFRNQFFRLAPYSLYDWIPLPGSFEQIVERIKPLVLQLSAEDYLRMPELIFIDRRVQLPQHVMELYRELDRELITKIDGVDFAVANEAVLGIKLRQIANGAMYDEDKKVIHFHDAKLDELENLLEELAGQPTLVLYEFEHDRTRILKRLQEVFGDSFVRYFKSGNSREYVAETVGRFNAGLLPCLLGHPASMGHGLNLQGACHHIIWFGLPWNLEFYDQAIARIYRQGQHAASVLVYHIVAEGTKDIRVASVLNEKDGRQQKLLKALGS
jgi:SNF2 family DNA or RNA helicase